MAIKNIKRLLARLYPFFFIIITLLSILVYHHLFNEIKGFIIFLIFFTLILFIENEFTETEKEYLQSVNILTTSTRTNIIEDFKERYNKLIVINFFDPSLKKICSCQYVLMGMQMVLILTRVFGLPQSIEID